MDWNFKVITENHCPRQFEYHPSRNGLIFGTMYGEVVAVDTITGDSTKSLGYFGQNKTDTILGLCWLKNNSNLFISGSSQGRVCCGDASKEFDVSARDTYSVVRDYPSFQRLTSVHINSTSSLLLMSGYSRGVRVCDLETGVVTHRYNSIHQDHINISRFANLSPHLFATSSFDGTIKTWDLRQPYYTDSSGNAGSTSNNGGASNINDNDGSDSDYSGGGASPAAAGAAPSSAPSSRGPIYTLKCKSGVVMINFSFDDVFLLASALDNEINQYLFLTGEKHLTYAIPKTGLAGNFTRAYYSASGRHAITGACEESTVKLLCTYTGDTLASVDMYPGKRDKSLYIQSLRGSPIDDNNMCVLANYRDLQQRELIMVNYTGKSFPSRQRLHDQQWYSGSYQGHEDITRAQKTVGSTTAGCDEVSELLEHPSNIIMDSTAMTSDASRPPHNTGTSSAVLSPKHYPTMLPTQSTVLDTSALEVFGSNASHFPEEENEDEYKNLTNNIFLGFYSPRYVSQMRSLRSLCRSMIHEFAVNLSDLPNPEAASTVTGQQQIELVIEANINFPDLSSDSGVVTASDGSDVAVLLHTGSSSSNSNEEKLQWWRWYVLPVHSFILAARCPKLIQLLVSSTCENIFSPSSPPSSSFATAATVPAEQLYTSTLKSIHTDSLVKAGVATADLAPLVPPALMYVFPIVLDYLYAGNRAVDLVVARYFTLVNVVSQHRAAYADSRNITATTATSAPADSSSSAASLGPASSTHDTFVSVLDILSPLVGSFLRADMNSFGANGTHQQQALMMPDSLKHMLRGFAGGSSGNDSIVKGGIEGATGSSRNREIGVPLDILEDVQSMLLVSIDEHSWHHNTQLSKSIVGTLTDFMQLAAILELSDLQHVVDHMLEQCMCVNNALDIYRAAHNFQRSDLRRSVAVYITSHSEHISSIDPSLESALRSLSRHHSSKSEVGSVETVIESDATVAGNDLLGMLLTDMQEIITSHNAEVLTRQQFRARKNMLDGQLYRAGPAGALEHQPAQGKGQRLFQHYQHHRQLKMFPHENDNDEIDQANSTSSASAAAAGHSKAVTAAATAAATAEATGGRLSSAGDTTTQPPPPEQSAGSQPGNTSAPRSTDEDADWMTEEMPVLDHNGAFVSSVCLPRYLSHTACPMLKESLLFIGGMNLERQHNLNSRILAYNIREDRFYHVTCGGTHLPKAGNLVCSGALQKDTPTHMVLLGGKLKKSEIAQKNTSLLDHLLHNEVTAHRTEVLGMGVHEGPAASGSACAVGMPAGATAVGAGKLDTRLKAKAAAALVATDANVTGGHVAAASTANVLWNINADAEELSAQAATARRAAALSATLSREPGPDDAQAAVQALAEQRRAATMSTMGLIYELNYTTMTWTSPSVLIGARSRPQYRYKNQARRGSKPAAFASNAFAADDYMEGEEPLSSAPASVFQFNDVASSSSVFTRDRDDQVKTALVTALKRRIGQSIATLYPEDVRYRCTRCMFRADFYNQELCSCQCAPRPQSMSHASSDDADFLESHACWLVQFAGYCGRDSTISNDLHVLICTPRMPPAPARTGSVQNSTVSDDCKTASSVNYKVGVDDDASSGEAANPQSRPVKATMEGRLLQRRAELEYDYRWVRTFATGAQPSARFSHSSTVVPYKPHCRQQAESSKGGVTGGRKQTNSSSGNGSSSSSQAASQAAARQTVELYEHTRIIIYGGIGYVQTNDLLLSLRVNSSEAATHYTVRNTPLARMQHDTAAAVREAAAQETDSYLHWEAVECAGSSPGRRHGHTMVYLPDKDMCVLFGGIRSRNEATGGNETLNDVWCLKLDHVHRDLQRASIAVAGSGGGAAAGGGGAGPAVHVQNALLTTLHAHWEYVSMVGIPPTPRTRHTCSMSGYVVRNVRGVWPRRRSSSNSSRRSRSNSSGSCGSSESNQLATLMRSAPVISHFMRNADASDSDDGSFDGENDEENAGEVDGETLHDDLGNGSRGRFALTRHTALQDPEQINQLSSTISGNGSVLLVFGGLDERRHQQEQEENAVYNYVDFDEKQKDSIVHVGNIVAKPHGQCKVNGMHHGVWETSIKPLSTYTHIARECSVPLGPCSLTKDMLSLLDPVFRDIMQADCGTTSTNSVCHGASVLTATNTMPTTHGAVDFDDGVDGDDGGGGLAMELNDSVKVAQIPSEQTRAFIARLKGIACEYFRYRGHRQSLITASPSTQDNQPHSLQSLLPDLLFKLMISDVDPLCPAAASPPPLPPPSDYDGGSYRQGCDQMEVDYYDGSSPLARMPPPLPAPLPTPAYGDDTQQSAMSVTDLGSSDIEMAAHNPQQHSALMSPLLCCPVYSSLLSLRCEWIRTLLSSSMKEAQTKQITLQDTDPAAFQLVLMYLYADAVMFTSVQDVVAVLELANQYSLDVLSRKCEGILVRLVEPENVCELIEYASVFGLHVLRAACVAELLRAPRAREVLMGDIDGVGVGVGDGGESEDLDKGVKGVESGVAGQTTVVTAGAASEAEAEDSPGERPFKKARERSPRLASRDSDECGNLDSSKSGNSADAADAVEFDLAVAFVQLSAELRDEIRFVCSQQTNVYMGNIASPASQTSSSSSFTTAHMSPSFTDENRTA